MILAMGCVACVAHHQEAGIARVGDHVVTVRNFQNFLEEATGQPWTAAQDRVAVKLLDQFLDQEVILEAGRRRGWLDKEPRAEDRERMVRELVTRLCGKAPAPKPEEVEAETTRELATTLPERVWARQLVFADETSAKKALKRLQDGEEWETVSRDMSLAPNAADGGALGALEKGSLPKEMEQVLFSMKPGTISNPVSGPGGIHIFQVLERRTAGHPDATEVRESVEVELEHESARRHMAGCLADLERQVNVRVFPPRLWFRYDGRRTEDRHETG